MKWVTGYIDSCITKIYDLISSIWFRYFLLNTPFLLRLHTIVTRLHVVFVFFSISNYLKTNAILITLHFERNWNSSWLMDYHGLTFYAGRKIDVWKKSYTYWRSSSVIPLFPLKKNADKIRIDKAFLRLIKKVNNNAYSKFNIRISSLDFIE